MMAVGMDLERVRRVTGGRVHLTPHVPDTGPVVTLCGQTFAEATYQATGMEADCRNCLRRSADPGRVSSAFFQSDVGAELLQRSLDEARARRREPRPETRPEPEPVEAPPAEKPAPPRREAPAIRALRSRTALRPTFENVYVSPEGVILRLAEGEVSHVTFEGSVDLRRRDGVLTIRVGDVLLEFDEA
jgi:hypothetical protein